MPDAEGRDFELRYFRDTDSREVDFVITDKLKPVMLVEVKTGSRSVSKSLKHLKRKFPAAEAYQVALSDRYDFISAEGIRVMPALKFLSALV